MTISLPSSPRLVLVQLACQHCVRLTLLPGQLLFGFPVSLLMIVEVTVAEAFEEFLL